MRSWRTDVRIGAPVQEVWDALVSNSAAFPWHGNAEGAEVRATGPIVRGTKVEIGGPGGTVLIVDECEPPRLLKLTVVTGSTRGESHFELHPAGNNTDLEHTLHLDLKGMRRFLGIFVGRSLKNEFHALRDRIELAVSRQARQ
ncbi:MAG TPA: SRPBCC family protein [Bacteroidota bacterium]|nr:SRPBCC family protein [Bacteroidota bacterium]